MIDVDPVQAALIAGGTLVAKDVASAAIKDACQGLISLIKSKFGGDSKAELILDSLDTKPEVWSEPLRDLLEGSEASSDPSVIQAAQELLEMIGPSQIAIGDYNVQVAGDVGLIVQGDYLGPAVGGIDGVDTEAKLSKMYELMPELLVEMQDDLKNDDTSLIREIYVLKSENSPFSGDKERFVFYKVQHENLLNKLDILEQDGFIDSVAVSTTPIYRMTDEFIQLLLQADFAG